MKTKRFALIGLTASLAAFSTTQAATIAWVGVNTNIDSTANDGATIGWNSTGNVKTLDGDGDNKLGTVGWYYVNGSGTGGRTGIRALPTTITMTNATTMPNVNIGASQVRDAPTVGVLTGNPATEAAIGAWWNNTTTATTTIANTFTIVDVASFTNGLRVGLLFDTQPGGASGSQTFTLTQTTGGSATATSTSLSFAANGMDAAFFDVTSLTNGDVFQISFRNTTGSFGHLSGITFDAIPEPSAALLGGLGMLALLRRRR